MIAYKGFNSSLCSVMGDGHKQTCQFTPGETKTAKGSKTARSGFHCCENPFACMEYYPLNGKNRFFEVEAAGDIDEDENERIACTQITLLKELTPLEIAVAGMRYMIAHPNRKKWEYVCERARVQQDVAEAKGEGHIAIARGRNPAVRGAEGSILGLLVEGDTGISLCKLFIADGQQAGKWYRLNEGRELEETEVTGEKENN